MMGYESDPWWQRMLESRQKMGIGLYGSPTLESAQSDEDTRTKAEIAVDEAWERGK